LAPSDYHLFGLLRNRLGGRRFADDEEVETEVRKWLRQQSKDFYYAAGFGALVKRLDKCINVGEDMPRNKCFLQTWISHVLHFISIYDLFTDSPSYKRSHLTDIEIFYLSNILLLLLCNFNFGSFASKHTYSIPFYF
jgi:hypothetical protein